MTNPDQTKSNWGVLAAVGVGVFASACCTVPLLLVTLGAGGAWVATFAAFEPFRLFFIAGAFGLLAFAGYREYRTTLAPECDCEITMRDHVRRGLLVIGLLVTVGLVASPTLIRSFAPQELLTAASLDPSNSKRVVLVVEGMTCDTCNLTVRRALMNLDGVLETSVTFEPPEAIVVYDPTLVSPEDMGRATTDVGYPSYRLEERREGVEAHADKFDG